MNFMVNGINMNDPNNQQVTFQPTINTVQEFIIDNSTFSAEYGPELRFDRERGDPPRSRCLAWRGLRNLSGITIWTRAITPIRLAPRRRLNLSVTSSGAMAAALSKRTRHSFI